MSRDASVDVVLKEEDGYLYRYNEDELFYTGARTVWKCHDCGVVSGLQQRDIIAKCYDAAEWV